MTPVMNCYPRSAQYGRTRKSNLSIIKYSVQYAAREKAILSNPRSVDKAIYQLISDSYGSRYNLGLSGRF